jgi:hypothetical protein
MQTHPRTKDGKWGKTETPRTEDGKFYHDHMQVMVRDVARGEPVRFLKNDTSPVWVKGHYDRKSKTYSFTRWDDSNDERFVKPTRVCFIGFTF